MVLNFAAVEKSELRFVLFISHYIKIQVIYFVSPRLTFNYRGNLEVNGYLAVQILAKCYYGSLWRNIKAPGPLTRGTIFRQSVTKPQESP